DYLKLESQLLEAGTEMNAPLILFGILGFVASFAISLGPVMWVMLPEIFPNCLRGVGMAVVGLFNTSVSYVVQLVFPWELETFGAAMTFFIYGVLALVNMIIVLMVFPETRGKSVEDLERILCRESPKKASSSAASMAGGNLTNGE
ncbi:MAG: MFS transporter, partial [bacterium]